MIQKAELILLILLLLLSFYNFIIGITGMILWGLWYGARERGRREKGK